MELACWRNHGGRHTAPSPAGRDGHTLLNQSAPFIVILCCSRAVIGDEEHRNSPVDAFTFTKMATDLLSVFLMAFYVEDVVEGCGRLRGYYRVKKVSRGRCWHVRVYLPISISALQVAMNLLHASLGADHTSPSAPVCRSPLPHRGSCGGIYTPQTQQNS